MKINFKTCLLFIVCFLFQVSGAVAQKYKPEDYGYRFFKTLYKKDTVDVVIVSKKGEELKKKPIILIEKGSLPIALVTLTDTAFYPIMPFNDKIFTSDYHLVYVSKPGVPAKVHHSKLTRNGVYNDPKG